MKIVWDEPKRRSNIDKHGFDFSSLSIDFFAAATFVPGKDGRLAALGWLEGQAVAVVFAPLGSEAVSIISMRSASNRERKAIR